MWCRRKGTIINDNGLLALSDQPITQMQIHIGINTVVFHKAQPRSAHNVSIAWCILRSVVSTWCGSTNICIWRNVYSPAVLRLASDEQSSQWTIGDMRFFFCKSASEYQVRDILGCCTKSLLVIVHITNLALPLSLAAKFKIILTFYGEIYEWCNENLVVQSSDEATKSKVIHAVWCNITREAAGQIRTWSLLGVRGLKQLTLLTAQF